MFTTETPESTQLWLDLRVPKWHQLELDLEYLSQPETQKLSNTGEWLSVNTVGYDDTISIAQIAPSALHINSSGETKSRLIVTPDLIIESAHKQPNALVRFFHKHLFNFTWETI